MKGVKHMKKTRDLDKLQGAWSITFLEMDGKAMVLPGFGDARVTLARDRFRSSGMGMDYEGVVALREQQKPKAFDLTFTTGPQRGTRHAGIYELAGDRWTLCFATRGSQRPKTFATKPDSGLVLETLQRGAPAARRTSRKSSEDTNRSSQRSAARPPAPSTATPTVLEGEWAMVSGVFNGVPLKEEMVKWCRRVTRGDITRVVAGPQVMLEARFAVDDSIHPHSIEYENLAGSNKGKKQLGICERRGDTLDVCMAAPGKPRPADFASVAGDGRSYTTWKFERIQGQRRP
jgi:uncharacterized protein (TIGR03067 family)